MLFFQILIFFSALISFGTAAETKPSSETFNVIFLSIPLRGHLNIQFAIADELARRGHNCTFLVEKRIESWIPVREYSQGRILAVTIDGWEGGDKIAEELVDAGLKTVPLFAKMLKNQFRYTYNDTIHAISKLVPYPDIAVVDTLSPAAFVALKMSKLPLIITSGFAISIFEDPLSVFPRATFSTTTLRTRIESFVRYYLPPILENLGFFSEVDKELRKLGIPPEIDLYPFKMNEMIIQATEFGFEEPRLVSPLHKFVGPVLPHPSEQPEISDSLLHVLDNSPAVIYASFGTICTLKKSEFKTLLDGLKRFLDTFSDSERPTVLWSLPKKQSLILQEIDPFKDTTADSISIASNFTTLNFIRFAPQIKLLNHDKVKLFVTHCGQNSISESLVSGTPAFGVPFFADQPAVCWNLERTCTGTFVEREFLQSRGAAVMISNKLKDLWVDKTYRDNAELVGKILIEAGGREKAADLVEWRYKWRNHNLEHLSLKESLKFSRWERYYLDIWSLVVAAVLILIICVSVAVYVLFRISNLLINNWRYIFKVKLE
ncbi:UDP-glucuronosyltransferase 1-1 [Nowakowskiella sp. JEL0407]|nr:UDP-glucuronosyltransferase 1-1 [Nowakowskiella sp. JEL0407]